MLNSPNNPTGKIFTREELEKLSKIFKEKCPDAFIVNDCVYESVVFDGHEQWKNTGLHELPCRAKWIRPGTAMMRLCMFGVFVFLVELFC